VDDSRPLKCGEVATGLEAEPQPVQLAIIVRWKSACPRCLWDCTACQALGLLHVVIAVFLVLAGELPTVSMQLYPSMVIAYNLCYSTCLGRPQHVLGASKLGATLHLLPQGALQGPLSPDKYGPARAPVCLCSSCTHP
jgi:hypothetical protein